MVDHLSRIPTTTTILPTKTSTTQELNMQAHTAATLTLVTTIMPLRDTKVEAQARPNKVITTVEDTTTSMPSTRLDMDTSTKMLQLTTLSMETFTITCQLLTPLRLTHTLTEEDED